MTKEKLIKLLKAGIEPNWYCILKLVKDEVDLSTIESTKLTGWITLLLKKGLLAGPNTLTEVGRQLVEDVEGTPSKILNLPNKPIEVKKTAVTEYISNKTDFSQFCKDLQAKLKARLKELTGKDHKYLDSNKHLIPSAGVIESRLKDAQKIYKFPIDDRIEKVLLNHIDKCVKANFFKVRTVEYFILGQYGKGSDLDTALDNFVEGDENISEFKSEIII